MNAAQYHLIATRILCIRSEAYTTTWLVRCDSKKIINHPLVTLSDVSEDVIQKKGNRPFTSVLLQNSHVNKNSSNSSWPWHYTW